MAYQWCRFIFLWLGQNSTVVQALTSIVTVLLTAILACITHRYVKLTRELARSAGEQSASAMQQLRLLAHPNPVVEVRTDREERSVSIKIINRGAYPFRLDNAVIEGADDEGKQFTMKLHNTCGVIVGSNDNARASVFLHERKIELDSGAFEDWLCVKFDCQDLIALSKKRYAYTKVDGLREL
jgi:archaellum component FlaG (FlaF/FlaG flagellin family)